MFVKTRLGMHWARAVLPSGPEGATVAGGDDTGSPPRRKLSRGVMGAAITTTWARNLALAAEVTAIALLLLEM